MQTSNRKFNTTLVTCFFLLKFENKFFFRFYKNYILFEKSNKKLLNQRIDFFLIKRRIKQLIYEFEFSSR